MDNPPNSAGRERPPDQPPIASEVIQGETKAFHLDLRENQRGRFLKITEEVRGRRNAIMVPNSALGEFLEALRRISAFEKELPKLEP